MSNDSVLKKEFKHRDVERLRNLVQGKYGEKTTMGTGYNKAKEFHNEGDVWEEDGRQWTIKNGIKQNITKMDEAKKAHVMPLFCPTCNKLMVTHRDKNYYMIHKKCLNCVIDFEHDLKKQGKWEEYQRNVKNNELDNRIAEFKLWVKEKLEEGNDSFVSESGEVERWVGKVNKGKVEEHVKDVIEYLESLKQ